MKSIQMKGATPHDIIIELYMKDKRSDGSSSSSSSPSKILGTPRPPVRFGGIVKVGDKVLTCFGPCSFGFPCKAKILDIELGEDGKWRYLLDSKIPNFPPFWVDADGLVKYSKRYAEAAFDAALADIKGDDREVIWSYQGTDYCRVYEEKCSSLQDATWKKTSLCNRIAAVENLIRHDARVAKEKRQEGVNHGKNAALQKHQAKPQSLTHGDILRKAIAGKKLCRKSRIEAQKLAKSLPPSRLKHG